MAPSPAVRLSLSRRRLLAAAAVTGLAVSVPGVARAAANSTNSHTNRFDGALGANFNQDLAHLDYSELRRARTRWVRGFYAMPDADDGAIAEQEPVKIILDAHRRGYGTVFSLKFPLGQSAVPAPGSSEMAVWLARLDAVLPLVINKVDILEIGNEPFIESRLEDRNDTLNVFYETVAQRVIDYRAKLSRRHREPRTRLYMGALNRLDLEANLTPAVERWLSFVKATPELDGVDIHPHVPSADRIPAFLDYVLPRIRPDQTFLVTEFSLVWHWQQHLTDTIPADFADRYEYPTDTLVWELIGDAIAKPFPQHQWDDFLNSSPWFERDFLVDTVQRFRATGRLAVATYGFRQDDLMTQNWGPNKAPWLFNSVIAPYTVQPDRFGRAGVTTAWLDSFRHLQRV
jgi:hypothetical protein